MRDITNFWGEKETGHTREQDQVQEHRTPRSTHGASIFSTLHPAALAALAALRSEFAQSSLRRDPIALLYHAPKKGLWRYTFRVIKYQHKRRSSDVHGDVSGPARRVSAMRGAAQTSWTERGEGWLSRAPHTVQTASRCRHKRRARTCARLPGPTTQSESHGEEEERHAEEKSRAVAPGRKGAGLAAGGSLGEI